MYVIASTGTSGTSFRINGRSANTDYLNITGGSPTAASEMYASGSGFKVICFKKGGKVIVPNGTSASYQSTFDIEEDKLELTISIGKNPAMFVKIG